MRWIVLFILSISLSFGQSVTSALPKSIDKKSNYLFYLHGGVVTVLGNNAINQGAPEWGPYQYLAILDSLKKRGFNVISENRREGIDDSVYATKLAGQIDTLLKAGVKTKNIIVVGASAGNNIMLHAAARLKNKNLRYVMMGGCSPDVYKEYTSLVLYGSFLSIIEATDSHGTCVKLFDRPTLTAYKEITLHTGLSHGFIYRGYKEWIDPVVEWFKK